MLKSAPHPNATKVFINWLLSKEGQELYTKQFWPFDQGFSRRTDVAPPEGPDAKAALAWLGVGIPMAWGVWVTLQSAIKIFG